MLIISPRENENSSHSSMWYPWLHSYILTTQAHQAWIHPPRQWTKLLLMRHAYLPHVLLARSVLRCSPYGVWPYSYSTHPFTSVKYNNQHLFLVLMIRKRVPHTLHTSFVDAPAAFLAQVVVCSLYQHSDNYSWHQYTRSSVMMMN